MCVDYERTSKKMDRTISSLEIVKDECTKLTEFHAYVNCTTSSTGATGQQTGTQHIIMSGRSLTLATEPERVEQTDRGKPPARDREAQKAVRKEGLNIKLN